MTWIKMWLKLGDVLRARISNIWPESSQDLSSVIVVPLQPSQQFYAEFILQKIEASDNIDFTLEIMSIG